MLFQINGYQVKNTQDVADHGIDLQVSSQQLRYGLVQCKRYRGTVGEPTVRDLSVPQPRSDKPGKVKAAADKAEPKPESKAEPATAPEEKSSRGKASTGDILGKASEPKPEPVPEPPPAPIERPAAQPGTTDGGEPRKRRRRRRRGGGGAPGGDGAPGGAPNPPSEG